MERLRLVSANGSSFAVGSSLARAYILHWRRCRVGPGPVWALGSVGSIGRFPTIAGVWYQTMLGEAGKPTIIMSLKYAHRWRVQRRGVRIIVPDQGLSDINGVLQQGAGWHGQSDYQP